MSKLKRLLFGYFGLLLLTACIVGGAIALWPREKYVPPPPPVPNGWDTFTSAAHSVQGPLTGPGALPLPVAIATNQAVLTQLRVGLTQKIQIPDVDPIQGPASATLKVLGQLLDREAEFFTESSRWTNAVASCLDAVRLGQALEQGVLIDALIGLSIEKAAWTRLEKLVPHLDSPTRAWAARETETLNQARGPFASLLAREKAWARAHATGFGQRLILATGFGLRPVYQRNEATWTACATQATNLLHLLQRPPAAP